MTQWLTLLQQLARDRQPCVLVTVAGTRGSAPREAGAKMVVTPDAVVGSIGGGQLEYACTELACQAFKSSAGPALHYRSFPLGAQCGQCCGGIVEVAFENVQPADCSWLAPAATAAEQDEPAVMVTAATVGGDVVKLVISAAGVLYDHSGHAEFAAAAQPLAARLLESGDVATRHDLDLVGLLATPALFEPLNPPRAQVVVLGAGHVGAALTDVLRHLPWRVVWADGRTSIFDAANTVGMEIQHQPERAVATAVPGTFFIVLTHSHALDLALCDRILARGDAAFCGLIGSRTKRRRFEKRLRDLGHGEAALASITCPIGVTGVSGKRPGEIAVAVAAQLLRMREQLTAGAHAEAHRARAT